MKTLLKNSRPNHAHDFFSKGDDIEIKRKVTRLFPSTRLSSSYYCSFPIFFLFYFWRLPQKVVKSK